MGKYLYRLRYTPAGLEGTIKEGFAAREAFFRERVASLGGMTEAAYWAYGDDAVASLTGRRPVPAPTLWHALGSWRRGAQARAFVRSDTNPRY